jgi:hypothetical protein
VRAVAAAILVPGRPAGQGPVAGIVVTKVPVRRYANPLDVDDQDHQVVIIGIERLGHTCNWGRGEQWMKPSSASVTPRVETRYSPADRAASRSARLVRCSSSVTGRSWRPERDRNAQRTPAAYTRQMQVASTQRAARMAAACSCSLAQLPGSPGWS